MAAGGRRGVGRVVVVVVVVAGGVLVVCWWSRVKEFGQFNLDDAMRLWSTWISKLLA